MGELSHFLTSKDIRGIWRSLQETVGKEASCNRKTSSYNLKWKMLVILPLQRSNELLSCLLCTVPLHREPRPPVPPCVPQREGGTCQPHSCPRDFEASPSPAGGTASPQHSLAGRGDEGREAAVAPRAAAEPLSALQINE